MKLNLIYYKNLVDAATEIFFKDYGDSFTKEDEKYILGLNSSKSSLKAILERCIIEAARSSVSTDEVDVNDVLVVIGSCYPKDNILLDFKDDSYFPKKLSSYISNHPTVKWVLSEKDIDIDIDAFNESLVSIFNDMFNDISKARDVFGCMYRDIMLVSHKKLDCYAMFKTVKWAYGSSNCLNLWKTKMQGNRCCMVALNDMISKYIHNKSKMNSSAKFKRYAHEVKDYLDKRLGF